MMPEQVEAIQEDFHRSPKMSIWCTGHKLQIPHSNIHDTVHKRLELTAYKLQFVKKLQENYLPWHYDFAFDIPSPRDEEIGYLSKVCCNDEATFHTSS
jgi:hypothetical protein